MENTELYNALSKKIESTSLLIKIFGILSIVSFAVFLVFTFFRTEKVPVSFDEAETGDYTLINVVKLEEYKDTDDYVYYYYTIENSIEEEDGCLKLSTEDAQSDIIRPLLNEEVADSPVCLYGYVRNEKIKGSVGGNSFSMNTEIFHASLEPELEKSSFEMIFTILTSFSLLITFISSRERKHAKRKIKLLSPNCQ